MAAILLANDRSLRIDPALGDIILNGPVVSQAVVSRHLKCNPRRSRQISLHRQECLCYVPTKGSGFHGTLWGTRQVVRGDGLTVNQQKHKVIESLMKTLVLFLLAFLWLAHFGKAQERRYEENAAENPYQGRSDAIEAGRRLFAGMCSGCHGAQAEGGRGPNLEDGQIVRLKDDHHLFDSIRKGVPGRDMPPFNLPDEQIWQLLAFIHSLSAPAAESQVPGDPEAGRVIFFGKAACGACHMILGHGGFTGPDLSNIGMSHSWKQLRQALLDPKSRSRAGYQGVVAVTKGGSRITGIMKDQTHYSAAILDGDGNLHLLSMRDIREITYRSGSLMPDDYDRRLTAKEIEDVLAFLSRQSVRPVTVHSSTAGHPKGPK
jgi:cytochrome c oxidase cbb3-type subunit III